MTRSVILGASGQDGAYLSRRLLDRGDEVIACMRPSSSMSKLEEVGAASRVIRKNFELECPSALVHMFGETEPHVVFNLAAEGFVAGSFDQPLRSIHIDAVAIVSILEAARHAKSPFKLIQASSSEMFGGHATAKVRTDTALMPSSPYGAAKAYCHLMVQFYRRAYGVDAASAILFNHESPLRSEQFVTRKISKGIAKALLGVAPAVRLGNLDGRRDWSAAQDIVDGLVLMSEANQARDVVFASGHLRSVRDFIEHVASWWGQTINWRGDGVDEVGVVAGTDKAIIEVDPAFYRPLDPAALSGDASEAQELLGWQPKITFAELVASMAEADAKKELETLGQPYGTHKLEALRHGIN